MKNDLLIDRKRYRDLVVVLNGSMDAEGKRKEEAARIIDVGTTTLYRYLKEPENMRLGDLNRLGRLLGIDIEELRKAAIRY